MSKESINKLQKYSFHGSRTNAVKVNHKSVRSRHKEPISTDYRGLKPLPPSLNNDLSVLFIGFNPGVESSRSQHHYAHHTNLFWKLFNESKFLLKVLHSRGVDMASVSSDQLLSSLIDNKNPLQLSTRVKPVHDLQLTKYHIGFSDLCLRCTKSASELKMDEKLDNIPRLLSEFKSSNSKKIVIIGKGIWEVFIKYIQKVTKKQHKTPFEWGKQESPYTEWLHQELDYDFEVHVLPGTSGLVASLKYSEKLDLWNRIVF